jgi:hypothetical protein
MGGGRPAPHARSLTFHRVFVAEQVLGVAGAAAYLLRIG